MIGGVNEASNHRGMHNNIIKLMHNNSTKVRLGGDSDDVGNVNMEGNLFYLLLQLLDS